MTGALRPPFPASGQGLTLCDQASLAALTDDMVKTSAIKDEALSVASPRCARLSFGGELLKTARLQGWHAALSPSGGAPLVEMHTFSRRLTPRRRTCTHQGHVDAPVRSLTLHSFDDSDERIAHAVGDVFLARADGSSQRFYSLLA